MICALQNLLTQAQLEILLARLESWRLSLKAGVSSRKLETWHLCIEFELPELSSSTIHDLVSGHFVMVRSFQSIVSSLHKIVKSFRKIVSSSHICYIYFF